MLDLHDIQGKVLAGFNTDYEVLVSLTREDGAEWFEIARWLADRAPDVATVIDVRNQRAPMKALEGASALSWLALAVGERTMTNTQPDLLFDDEAFRRGMIRRAGPVLGDRTAPDKWSVGGSSSPVDVLLIVASNDRSVAENRAEELLQSASSVGLIATFTETTNKIKDLEHFGFRDGISQPKVTGFDPGGDLGAGYFVFGYPRSPGLPPVTVQQDPRELTRNGSLMVLRRLRQDVQKFRSFCDAEAARLQQVWPGLTPSHLQSLLVGRWPNGALVAVNDTVDPGKPTSGENDFDFTTDPDGTMCPFGAHIRKVNPRQGPRDVVDVPRMLRRGIPFGPAYEDAPAAGRGLMFISFQTSITDAFEFITAKWMNVPEKPAPGAGHDMLVGRASPVRSMTIKSPFGGAAVSDGGLEWITPTGGAYLFAPSRSGLEKMSSASNMSLPRRFRRIWTLAGDYVASH